jgi:hypothetical protein
MRRAQISACLIVARCETNLAGQPLAADAIARLAAVRNVVSRKSTKTETPSAAATEVLSCLKARASLGLHIKF